MHASRDAPARKALTAGVDGQLRRDPLRITVAARVFDWRRACFYRNPPWGLVCFCTGLCHWLIWRPCSDCWRNYARTRDQVFFPGPDVDVPKQDPVPAYEVPIQDLPDFVLGQDLLCWVAQGEILDRSKERLGESDRGLVMFRNMLKEQIKLVQDRKSVV